MNYVIGLKKDGTHEVLGIFEEANVAKAHITKTFKPMYGEEYAEYLVVEGTKRNANFDKSKVYKSGISDPEFKVDVYDVFYSGSSLVSKLVFKSVTALTAHLKGYFDAMNQLSKLQMDDISFDEVSGKLVVTAGDSLNIPKYMNTMDKAFVTERKKSIMEEFGLSGDDGEDDGEEQEEVVEESEVITEEPVEEVIEEDITEEVIEEEVTEEEVTEEEVIEEEVTEEEEVIEEEVEEVIEEELTEETVSDLSDAAVDAFLGDLEL